MTIDNWWVKQKLKLVVVVFVVVLVAVVVGVVVVQILKYMFLHILKRNFVLFEGILVTYDHYYIVFFNASVCRKYLRSFLQGTVRTYKIEMLCSMYTPCLKKTVPTCLLLLVNQI